MRDNHSGGALTETTLLVLLCLRSPLHGYGVKLKIAQLTNERVQLGMGTLYGALKTLLNKRWIQEVSQTDGRINYQVTPAGKAAINREYQRLQELQILIENKGE